jgi:hypothetical protein
MSETVWLSTNTLSYPQGGGHMWVYLNWALGLRDVGCDVVWLEGTVKDGWTPGPQEITQRFAELKARLAPYGFADRIALWTPDGQRAPEDVAAQCLTLEGAENADLLLNINYQTPGALVARFRRSALVDIDPGLLQTWLSDASYNFSIPPHTVLFTTGETVGTPDAKFPDLGFQWHYTPPCVAIGSWPITRSAPPAPLTTVSHWYSYDWLKADTGELRSNEKRTGFMPFLNLPSRTSQTLELALQLREEDEADRATLLRHGWRVRDAWAVAATPWDYQQYIQSSFGEFSCVKPSCVRLQNAWISDRSLCYLASGKPAVVEYTGPSRFLPDDAGLLRFRDLAEAIECVEAVQADYEKHCRLARTLAEEYFDAKRVVKSVLERALA